MSKPKAKTKKAKAPKRTPVPFKDVVQRLLETPPERKSKRGA
jgi:hypothetical protein